MGKYLQSVNVVKKTPVEEHLGETKEEITIPIANQKPRENFDFNSSSGGSPKNTSLFNFYEQQHHHLRPNNNYHNNNSSADEHPRIRAPSDPNLNPPSDSEQCIFDLD